MHPRGLAGPEESIEGALIHVVAVAVVIERFSL